MFPFTLNRRPAARGTPGQGAGRKDAHSAAAADSPATMAPGVLTAARRPAG